MWTHVLRWHRIQKRVSDLLELEPWIVFSCHFVLREKKKQITYKSKNALHFWANSPVPRHTKTLKVIANCQPQQSQPPPLSFCIILEPESWDTIDLIMKTLSKSLLLGTLYSISTLSRGVVHVPGGMAHNFFFEPSRIVFSSKLTNCLLLIILIEYLCIFFF